MPHPAQGMGEPLKAAWAKPSAAFEEYLRDPPVQKALAIISGGSIVETLLRDCFMRGARYASDTLKATSSSSEAKLSGSSPNPSGAE